MSKVLATKNVAAVLVGVGLVLAMGFAFATPAKAQTSADLQAQIQALLAQIAALQGGGSVSTGAGCFNFTRSQSMGQSGGEIMWIQKFLNAHGAVVATVGAGSPGNESAFFGAKTKAAVASFQAMNGISPAAGFWGPITRAKANAICSTPMPPAPPGPPGPPGSPSPSPSGPLNGSDGSISDVNELGAYNNEEVAEGNNDVKVLGAEVEASNDGDIRLSSIKVSFDPTGNTGSDNLDDYLDEVSVWLGNTKIGSANVDDFTQDSNDLYTKTISLSNAVIRADQVQNLYIAVDAVNNIDTSDISGDSWLVDVENIRFVDGSGVTTTDTSTGDIDGMDVPIDFVSFSTSANTELKISTASNTPAAGTVMVDDTSNTDNVSLLKGKLKLDGDSDVNLDEFPITFTVASTTGITDAITANAAGLSMVAGSVTLKIGGNEYSESMSNATVVSMSSSGLVGTVTFDNMDFDISGGQTVDFEVLADVNDTDDTGFVVGDTLKADVTASNRNLMDVENQEHDQLSDSSEKSGTATGNAQEFRLNGIQVTFVSASTASTAGTSANDDLGTFTIRYKVKAVGDTIYVSSLAAATTTTTGFNGNTVVLPDRAGTATIGGTSVTLANLTDSDLNSTGLYQIEEGEEETFEVTTTVQLPSAGSAGQYRTVLGGIAWDTDSTDAKPDNLYTSDLGNFKTSYLGLN